MVERKMRRLLFPFASLVQFSPRDSRGWIWTRAQNPLLTKQTVRRSGRSIKIWFVRRPSKSFFSPTCIRNRELRKIGKQGRIIILSSRRNTFYEKKNRMVREKATNLRNDLHTEIYSIHKDSVVYSGTGHHLGGFTHQNQQQHRREQWRWFPHHFLRGGEEVP